MDRVLPSWCNEGLAEQVIVYVLCAAFAYVGIRSALEGRRHG